MRPRATCTPGSWRDAFQDPGCGGLLVGAPTCSKPRTSLAPGASNAASSTSVSRCIGPSAWAGGAVVGSLVGMLLFNAHGARLDAHGETLVLPGTWKTLLISQLFFAVKYYFGYQQAVHPLLLSTPDMVAAIGAVSGFTVGLFCGRAITLQRALAALRRDEGNVLP